MSAAILARLPTTIAHTIISDPDHLFDEPDLIAELTDRYAHRISSSDSIAMLEAWYAREDDKPTLIITPGGVDTVPYPIWDAAASRIIVSLADILPGFDHNLARALTSTQRDKIASHLPLGPLSTTKSLDIAINILLGWPIATSLSPVVALGIIDRIHREGPFPQSLIARLQQHFRQASACTGWPLHQLFSDPVTWQNFIQEQFVASLSNKIGEATMMLLPFAADTTLQDALPRWQRDGVLGSVILTPGTIVPVWAEPFITRDWAAEQETELATLVAIIDTHLATAITWVHWQDIARDWARATVIRTGMSTLSPALQITWEAVMAALDGAFLSWLQLNYTALGSRRLPIPHHLHHIPDWIAYHREQMQKPRQALLVMDGMSLATWQIINSVWKARHPGWSFGEQLLLAQLPSITCVSRQAIISGQRPATFAANLTTNTKEATEWQAYWHDRHHIPNNAILYHHFSPRDIVLPESAKAPYCQILGFVSTVIDKMLHGATQGLADVHNALRVWLRDQSTQYERLIELLLEIGYTIHITSDHGHVAATGIGQPQEGVMVTTRSKRARLYADVGTAERVQQQFPDTVAWNNDSLLPENVYALLAGGRSAFATAGELVVSHGGATIDEVIVPLITITRY